MPEGRRYFCPPPASTALSDDGLQPVLTFLFILFVVSCGILIFIFFLHIVIVSLPSEAAQLASPPPSDDTVDYGPVDTSIAFVGVWVSFVVIFCLILNAVLYFVIYGLVPPGAPLRAPRGLDPAIMKTFPIVLYSAVKGLTIREAPLECAVCLSRFKDDSKLQLIPKCEHAFHPNCIDKWFASHTTCPVCRTNLASQLVVHSASQLPEASTEPPLVEVEVKVEVKVEASTPDGGAPERIPQEDGHEQIQSPDLWDKIGSSSFGDRNQAHGSGGIGRFPRSHSTGHSLTRPGEDVDRFTLRLPALVRKQMIDRPGPIPPLEGCPRQGYLCGGSSPGSYYFSSLARLDQATKAERWTFKRISSTVAADGGEGSSRSSVQQTRPAI